MKKNYRICIIGSAHWSAAMGGIEYQEKLLIEKLKMIKSIETFFVTSDIDQSYKPEGYHIVFIDVSKLLKTRASFFGAFKLFRILRAINPNAIYQNGASSLIGIAAFYSRRNNCNLVWHVASDNNVAPRKKFSPIMLHKLLERKLFEYGIKRALKIVVLTNYQGRLARNINKMAEIHLVRNFHPVPEERFPDNKKNQIIWVANFKALKQPEIFIDLAKALIDKKIAVNCIMIGAPVIKSPAYQEMLEEKINQCPNLIWLGKQPVDIVNKYINESRILVNTSKWEGFPNTYIQAWMRGTPVITLNCDPDNLLTRLGIGMHSGSFEKLVEDVLNLLKSDELRISMGKKAIQYAFQNHSLDNIDQILEIMMK